MKYLVEGLLAYLLWIEVALVVLILVFATVRRKKESDKRWTGVLKWMEGPVWYRVLWAFWGLVILIPVFSGWLAAAPAAAQPPGKTAEKPVIGPPYSFCLVYAFPDPSGREGEAQRLADLPFLPDEPAGCLHEIAGKIATATHVALIGRNDQRRLPPEAARQHHSNAYLALERARSMMLRLKLPEDRTDLLTAGPRYLGNKMDARLLERDRSVEIRAYWSSASAGTGEPPPKAPGKLNTEILGTEVSIALLVLMVALSAYLATVGLFLRERGGKLGEEIRADGESANDRLRERSASNTMQRKLLILADAPMILAAYLLFLHVFAFYPPPTLDASILLFKMAAVTFVLFHAAQWITASSSEH